MPFAADLSRRGVLARSAVHSGQGAADGDIGRRRDPRPPEPAQPYAGKIDLVEKDSLAGPLVVDGDPLADLGLSADPAAKLKVIMKDGRFQKNTPAG